jgi:hypothetical protein
MASASGESTTETLLHDVACLFHQRDMVRIDQRRISEAILSAPGWARVGITMPDERMRLRAADGLAASILEQLQDAGEPDGTDQLTLPI